MKHFISSEGNVLINFLFSVNEVPTKVTDSSYFFPYTLVLKSFKLMVVIEKQMERKIILVYLLEMLTLQLVGI